jgi:hypothetical protein
LSYVGTIGGGRGVDGGEGLEEAVLGVCHFLCGLFRGLLESLELGLEE